MASEKQIRANRQNALRSTGPKTEEGKSVVRLNAVRHGALAETVVIPHMESEEEWEEHRRGILESLAPVGDLERALAERAADLLWRLRRAARYEREIIANEQEEVEGRVLKFEYQASELEDLRHEAKLERASADLMESLPTMRGKKGVEAAVAIALLEAAAKKAKGFKIEVLKLSDAPDMCVYDVRELCAEELRQWITAMAESVNSTFEEMLESVAVEVYYRAAKAELELKAATAKVGRARRLCLLPDPKETDRVARYEAHLDRSLYKALHELQRLQAARRGEVVPAPVAVDVTGVPEKD